MCGHLHMHLLTFLGFDPLDESQLEPGLNALNTRLVSINFCQPPDLSLRPSPWQQHRPGGGDVLVVLSVIDNLVKGASGQAIQCMNLMFGLEETAGIDLPALLP